LNFWNKHPHLLILTVKGELDAKQRRKFERKELFIVSFFAAIIDTLDQQVIFVHLKLKC
jgi:hypothetical protein